MRVLIVGAGAVGQAFAAAWQAAELEVMLRPGRRPWQVGEVVPPEAALLAVADRAIAEVAHAMAAAEVIAPHTVLLHAAGALDPQIVFAAVRPRVAGVGLCHPLRALAHRRGGADALAGALFAVAGDPQGCATAKQLVLLARGYPVMVQAAGLARYHAAAALVANHTLALVGAAVDVLVGEGFPRREAERALGELLCSAADNVARLGLPAALTGPMARGDAQVVASHLAALPPEPRALYLATAAPTLALARAKGTGQEEGLTEIARLLDSTRPAS